MVPVASTALIHLKLSPNLVLEVNLEENLAPGKEGVPDLEKGKDLAHVLGKDPRDHVQGIGRRGLDRVIGGGAGVDLEIEDDLGLVIISTRRVNMAEGAGTGMKGRVKKK